ncbi:MAG: peptidyl-prolyl cis-trans isomerase, partial [Acidobacteriota bacterium]
GYTEQLEEIRRQVVVQQGLIDEPPAFEPPTDAEIQERYEMSLDAVGDVTQRFVLTIFRRRAAGQDPAPLVAEMEDLRRRVAAGESFTVLARDHSDSESRHMDGAVGWVRRGQMPPDLDRILFSLEEGVPSEPVVTAEGVHLFYIETELDGTIPEPEAVADKIRQTLVQERRALALQNLVTSTELPPGALVPSDAELRELLGNSDEETLLLRVGDAELRLGELRGKVAQRLRQDAAEAQSPGSLAVAIFNGIKQREILYTRFSGIDLPPEIQARFDRQEEIFRVQRYAEHRVDQEIASRREALQAFYDRHRNRFVSLLEVKLEALVVPLGEAPGRVMAVLESRRPELASGDLQMEDLATEVGGEVQLTERVDINTLMGHRAKAAFFAPSLGVGDVSPPYSTGQSIEIFRVLERREPEPLALEAAREQVHLAYRERHGQQIYDTLVADLLASVGFEVAEENLGAFVEGRNPPPSSTGEGNGSE